MKIVDEGFYLYSKKYGEKSKIIYILSKKNGLIRGLSRYSKSQTINLINLDKIDFTWSSRDKNGLGFVKFEQQKKNNIDNNLFLIVKASASELCIRFLPFWEENIEIYNDILDLSLMKKMNENYLLGKYIYWETKFLKNLGYGFEMNECAISGKVDETYFISPKTGNSVCYKVGEKYAKSLFKIPFCIKDQFRKESYKDYYEALKITEFFLLKILETKKLDFVFRNQVISYIKKS
jgi:DNA repair protein RecO (recombination protein O)